MMDRGQLDLTSCAAMPTWSADEIIVDNFCGGGGAGQGMREGLDQETFVAINHSAQALAMHAANHPSTIHLQEDVYKVNPRVAVGGRRVGLAWFSPDCTHHSRAKGGVPRSNKSRGLAWVAVRWAKEVQPRIIMLENVEGWTTWGPLLRATGQPCKRRRGQTYRAFVRRLQRLGYVVEARVLSAHHYGAPTIRKRVYLVARRDGAPIAWPARTHGPGLIPYRTAGECIDFTLPARSIFERTKPLADKTMARIAHGIRRWVDGAADPYLVGGKAHALIQTGYGERKGQAPRVLDLAKPLGTIVAGGQKHALVVAWLAKHYGGHGTPGSSLAAPIGTITTIDHHALVCAFLVRYNGFGSSESLAKPLGTITTLPRFALVMIHGEPHVIVDITMRMLTPRELATCQGFPRDYVIDHGPDGAPLTIKAQVHMIGNSVSPVVPRALVRVNCPRAARAGRRAA